MPDIYDDILADLLASGFESAAPFFVTFRCPAETRAFAYPEPIPLLFLPGPASLGGALAPMEHATVTPDGRVYLKPSSLFEESFAHLMADGFIRRFGAVIGCVFDLTPVPEPTTVDAYGVLVIA